MSFTASHPSQHPALRPSAQFRKEVAKVAVSIFLFILLYIALLIAGLLLGARLGYWGLALIAGMGGTMGLLLGAGMVGIGVMVCFFLIKFLFATKPAAEEGAVQIEEADYPELFALVREVSEAANTGFPKRVYLTSEVNAYVSYDSNLASLLFPVRKNLTIGLGLLNMTNKSEFRAVLAHEFGHFSQGSMRAGSYVYQVNRVIYNLLYENTSYSNTLSRWASIHSVFALCAAVTGKIVGGIQWILQQAYKVINKQYMSLSRQMEFHADAVAACCAGSNNMITALRRIEFGDVTYQLTLEKYNSWVADGYKAANLFAQHRIAGAFTAKANRLPEKNGLPDVSNLDELLTDFHRVNIEDQWASHPTRAQREKALMELDVVAAADESDPWTLLGTNAAALQESFTAELYKPVEPSRLKEILDDALFREKMAAETERDNYPGICGNFYDRRLISRMEPEDVAAAELPDLPVYFLTFGDQFRKLQSLREDIEKLERVLDTKQGIRYFDFDGEKLPASGADAVKETLKRDLEDGEAVLVAHDTAVAGHFKAVAVGKGKEGELAQLYRDLYRVMDGAERLRAIAGPVLESLQRIYGQEYTLEAAAALSGAIGIRVKEARALLNEETPLLLGLSLLANERVPDEVAAFHTNSLTFFAGNSFRDDAINSNWSGAMAIIGWTYDLVFAAQKNLVIWQLQLAGLKSGKGTEMTLAEA